MTLETFYDGLLAGLDAAALICQEKAGDKNSNYSDAIMAYRQKIALKNECEVKKS